MTTPPPHLRNTSGSSFRQRLGYFLTGTAIGLVALGFITASRQNAARQQQADREAEARKAEIDARDAEEPADRDTPADALASDSSAPGAEDGAADGSHGSD